MTPYPADIKAAAMAALLTGQSVSAIAAQYNIPEGTLWSWRNRDLNANHASDASQRKTIGELLEEYLRASLQTLKAQVEIFADREWLQKQDASELAVLHGVCTDKAIRLLESLAPTEAGAPEPERPDNLAQTT
jgi:transposase-like protein